MLVNACPVFWSFCPAFPRIRINKQLEVEPEEPVPLEEEGEQPKAARRKQKRPRKDSAPLVEAMEEKLLALPLPGVLMVEVDNVLHEEFQVTEEVKVSLTLAQVSSDLESSVFF